jgi:hypothetical protein
LDNPAPELESGAWFAGIKTVHCVPAGEDHFGALKGGSYLRILAGTTLVQLQKVEEELVLLHVKSDKPNAPVSISTTDFILDVDISESAGEDHVPDGSILMMAYLSQKKSRDLFGLVLRPSRTWKESWVRWDGGSVALSREELGLG